MARSSHQESDAIIWQPVGLPLGLAGLDLRSPTDPKALSKLINARFRDERTIQRRNGYEGVLIQDASPFPQALDNNDALTTLPMTAGGWVYGHGQTVAKTPLSRHNDHLPIPGVARGTFQFDGSDVVWTGDRLLVIRRDGQPALGRSAFWNVDNEAAPTDRGMPAYLPVQEDSAPPGAVTGDYVETCLTETVRVTVTSEGDSVRAWVTSRETGVLINETVLVGDDEAVDLRVLQSGAFVVCLWRDAVTKSLYISAWTGAQWVDPVTGSPGKSLVSSACDAYDVAAVSGGFHLLKREDDELLMGRYSGLTSQSTPYDFDTALTISATPTGPVALAVAPNGKYGVVWQSDEGLSAAVFNEFLTQGTEDLLSDLTTTWDGGITVCARALSASISHPQYPFVVHAATTDDPDGNVTRFWEFRNDSPVSVIRSDARWNTILASKSFRVGNEVFCWLRTLNSDTLFLAAGAFMPQVCAIADREEASESAPGLVQVNPDPLDGYTQTWARTYNTRNEYNHAGNARIGTIRFLPSLSVAHYGKSAYLAGSLVRNYDGVELGDAGFHDYPQLAAHSSDNTGGSLTAEGSYQVRVYPVRYNRRGERFQGPALTYTAALSGDHNRIGWQIPTIPCINHADALFEVYRTEAGGTTFYLDGTVENDLTQPSVVFYSTRSDADLRDGIGDPHEVGVGGVDEVEEMGPLGCALLSVASDRLWGAGGQVPRGWVQFSKLKEQGEGAGFDSIAGFQEIDTEGGEITSLVAHGDSTLIFERDRIYILTGSGPNNFGGGAFSVPQLRLADGAVNHLGTVTSQLGTFYWASDGPRLIDYSFRVQNVASPVRPFTATMTPSGAQIDLARQEVVWFTEHGNAVLLNYQNGVRWAQWTGLKVAGCSPGALATTDGRLLTESADAYGDNGVPFEFAGASGELSMGMFGADVQLNEIGLVGAYHGPHRLRVKTYYNGSPLWSDRWEWSPTANSWLVAGDELSDMTPAEIDAMKPAIKNGSYAQSKRAPRHTCRHFRVEWTDIASDRPTYTPYELSLRVGTRGGLGRNVVGSFGS